MLMCAALDDGVKTGIGNMSFPHLPSGSWRLRATNLDKVIICLTRLSSAKMLRMWRP